MKLQPLEANGKPYGHAHWCPGCQEMHRLPEGWVFNGSLTSPSFAPSFAHTMGPPDRRRTCHYTITSGVIDYHADSSHTLRGKVPMPDIPEGLRWPGS